MKFWIAAFIFFISMNAVATEKYEIPSGIVRLSHSRSDLSLEQISMQVSCFDENENSLACRDIKVEGTSIKGSIDFPAIAQHQAKAPQITLEIDNSSGSFFCVGMKAFFKGFPNACDSVLYPSYPDRRRLDRYSVLSYCSKAEINEESGAGSRYTSRRVANWQDYLYLLKQPISLALTDASPDECVIPE